MIDDLKLLLDQIKAVPDVALWVLWGFLFYKLVTYLSLTGSVVYVIRLITDTAMKCYTQPKTFSFHGRLINEEAKDELAALMDKLRYANNQSYIHASDLLPLREAVEKIMADKAEERRKNQSQANAALAGLGAQK